MGRISLIKYFKKIDTHGEAPAFEVEGGSTHKTVLGALLSLASLFVVLAYTAQKSDIWMNRYDMIFQSTTNFEDLDVKKEFGKEQGMNFAIGWLSREDLTNNPLYGDFSLEIVKRGPKEFETITLSTHVCTAADKKNFNAPPTSLAAAFDGYFEGG